MCISYTKQIRRKNALLFVFGKVAHDNKKDRKQLSITCFVISIQFLTSNLLYNIPETGKHKLAQEFLLYIQDVYEYPLNF